MGGHLSRKEPAGIGRATCSNVAANASNASSRSQNAPVARRSGGITISDAKVP